MAIAWVYATESDVPERLREHYVRDADGRFVLNVTEEEFARLPSVAPIVAETKKLAEEATSIRAEIDRRKANAELAARLPADWTPEKIAELRKLASDGFGLTPAERIAQIEAAYEVECAKRDVTLQEMDDKKVALKRQIAEIKIDRVFDAEMDEAGVAMGYRRGVKAMLENSVTYSDVTGVMIATEHGAMNLSNFFRWWSATPEGLPFIAPGHVPTRTAPRPPQGSQTFASESDSCLAIAVRIFG